MSPCASHAARPRPQRPSLTHRLDELGWTSLLAAPLLGQLVEARLLEGYLDGGHGRSLGARRDRARAPARTRRGARRCGPRSDRARRGREDAAEILLEAVNRFAELGARLDAARTRLELARALAFASPDVAIDTARHARTELEALGALRDADAAAALLRSLGAKGRAGPRATGLLSRRETEVLRLLAEACRIARSHERLFISPKTAEHHVVVSTRSSGVQHRAPRRRHTPPRNLGSE